MDTSTSQLDPIARYVIGNTQLEQTDITQRQWVQIITHEFEPIKPKLKYMSTRKPIKDFINWSVESSGSWQHVFVFQWPLSVLQGKFPEDISLDQNVLEIGNMSSDDWKSDDMNQRDTILVVTSSGKLLTLKRHYKRVSIVDRTTTHVGQSLQVRSVDWNDLPLVNKRGKFSVLGGSILDSLYAIVAVSYRDKLRMTRELRDMRRAMKGVRSRIRWLSKPRHCIMR